MRRLGELLVRRARLVLWISFAAVVASIPVALGVGDRLVFQALDVPGSESAEGQRLLDEQFGLGVANLTLLVTATTGSVDDPDAHRAGRTLTGEVSDLAGLTGVVSYFTNGAVPALRSTSGEHALIVATIPGGESEVDRWLQDHIDILEAPRDHVQVRTSGFARFFREATEVSLEDFESAELITIPIVLLALLLVFGAFVAAAMPLVVAVISVLGTVVFLTALTFFTDVSNFALTLMTALALGLGVDYSLFVVSRFREELANGRSVEEAVARSVETAGRTVLFSAMAVVVALAGLLVVPLASIRAIGYAAIATALIASVASVVVLPALLAVLGHGIDRGRLRRVDGRTAGEAGRDHGRWFRLATASMRRPVLVAIALVGALVFIASPVRSLDFGLTDERTFEEGNEVRETAEIIRSDFDVASATPLYVVVPEAESDERLESFAASIAELANVDAVQSPTETFGAGGRPLGTEGLPQLRSGDAAYLVVTTTVTPVSSEMDTIIGAIRSLDSGFERVLVTGQPASIHDIVERVIGSLPLLISFVAIVTFLVLFLQFGSILVPLKAIGLNALSIVALLGAMVWVFQQGHLSGILGFTATGTLYLNIPILVFALAFGLSMDYEVFILSRIKEEYDITGDNDLAIATGLDKSGGIVSAAAVLIAVVFATVGLTASMRLTKVFGLGLAAVVMLDAFVIRATLVPALMKLAGDANWWAPGPLRRLQRRYGFSEHGPGSGER